MARATTISKQSEARSKRPRRIKNPAPAIKEHLHPFPQMRPIASVPGVNAVLKRAQTPYKRNPLSEDEALNLVCDARSHQPTYPIKKLFRKFGHDMGD